MNCLHLHGIRPFLLFALASVAACSSGSHPLEEQLQSSLDRRIQQYDVKGASAAVLFPEGTMWTGTSGVSHDEVAMRPNMVFGIGSITKNVVAALTLQLAEEGKLSLDDPLSCWLPPYPHVDGNITIRQLLNHTSGIYMFWENQQIWDDLTQYRTRHFTPEEVLSYIKEPDFPPGEGSRYSNTNYLLAAMIITRATDSSLSVELRKRFWEPLGLRSASLAVEEPYPENMAHVWGQNFEPEGVYRDVTLLPRTSHDSIGYGSAGVFMTAEDLARWADALFNGRVINHASLEQMLDVSKPPSQGLGLWPLGRGVVGRFDAVGHGGGNIGSTSYMVYLPDREISIAVMINHFGGDCAGRIVRDLASISANAVRPESVMEVVWSLEGAFVGVWLIPAIGIGIYSIRRKKPYLLILFGAWTVIAGWLTRNGNVQVETVLIPLGAAIALFGLAIVVRTFASKRSVIRN